MKKQFARITLCLALTSALLWLTACSSTTRSEDGVTIERNRSYNPLNYIPGF